jgi:hypothetical protein
MMPPWEFLGGIVVWLLFCVSALVAAILTLGVLYWFFNFAKGFFFSAKRKRKQDAKRGRAANGTP